MSVAGRITRWWWIRHAPVRVNNGRIYGRCDTPCDVSDAAGLCALAMALPADAVWVTSNLLRTRQTAAALRTAGAVAPPEPHAETDLAEQSFGDWQGLTWEELAATRNGRVHRFWLAPAHETPPGGESFADLMTRVQTAVLRLTEEHPDRDIVAVTHGGTIRAALALALGLTPERALAFTVENLSLTRIDHVGRGDDGHAWRVATVNRLFAAS